MKRFIQIEPTGENPTESQKGKPSSQQHSGVTKALLGYSKVAVEDLSQAVSAIVDSVADAVKPKADGPESCQVKFALKITGNGNVILAKMGSEISLEVTITWKR